MNRANNAVVRLIAALTAQLEGTSEVVLLLGGAIEDVSLANHHDAAMERCELAYPMSPMMSVCRMWL